MRDTDSVLFQYVTQMSFTAVFCAMRVYIENVDLHEKYEVFNENKIDGNDIQMLVV